jgi:hypothetical protein
MSDINWQKYEYQFLKLVVLGVDVPLFSVVSLDGETSGLTEVQLVVIYLMAASCFSFSPL